MKILKYCGRCISIILSCSLLLTLPISANSLNIQTNISSTTNINKNEYYNVIESLNQINLALKNLDNNSPEYEKLINQYNTLNNSLENMGALIDSKLFMELFQPDENFINALPGNLGDIEEYYENWFDFSGYEEQITVGNTQYRAYIVNVRDDPEGDLLTNKFEQLIIQENEAGTRTLAELLNTSFGLSFDYAYNIWGSANPVVSQIASWTASLMFSSLINHIEQGTVTITNVNSVSYRYKLSSVTNLLYVYVWNEVTQKWVHCLSSNQVYLEETNRMYFDKYTGNYPYPYEEDEDGPYIRYFSLSPFPVNSLGTTAVGIYTSNGNSAPLSTYAYDVERIKMLKNNTHLGYLFPVTCPLPGNLWQLGSMV